MSSYIYKPILPSKIHRLAAFLIDAIAFVILFTGALYIISIIFDFDAQYSYLQEQYKQLGYLILNEKTGKYEYITPLADNYELVVELITEELDMNQKFQDALFFVNSFSIKAPLAAIAIVLFFLEFIIPLILKNGQTIGMKIFHIGLISKNNLAINPIQLFARCIIGKIAVLGIIPGLGLLFIFLNTGGGLMGTLMVLIVYVTHISLLLTTQNSTGIADMIAQVYCVNTNETIIYKTQKELDEAVKNLNQPLDKKGK